MSVAKMVPGTPQRAASLPSVGAPLRATAQVPVTADIAGIIKAAGGDLDKARYDNGLLIVPGVPQEALDAAAAAADILFAARVGLKAKAAQELQKRLDAGMPWVNGTVLQIDEASIARITAAATGAQAGALPPGFTWRMADNTPLPLDAAGMIVIGGAALAYVYALRARYWQIADEAMGAADEAALAQIDPTKDWPAPPTPPAA